MNEHVQFHGPFPPIKLFKHGSKTLYYKNMGGVDGATQYSASLRSQTGVLRREQKLIVQILKTLVVKKFISWRMKQRLDLLETSRTLWNLDCYRNILNKVQSFGHCWLEVAPEILRHESRTATAEGAGRYVHVEIKSKREEESRLRALAESKKRNRVTFFNTVRQWVLLKDIFVW